MSAVSGGSDTTEPPCVFAILLPHEPAKYEVVLKMFGVMVATRVCEDCAVEYRTNPDLHSITSLRLSKVNW